MQESAAPPRAAAAAHLIHYRPAGRNPAGMRGPARYSGITMRIAIDIRKLNDYGIGTYLRNLLRQLARIDHDTEYVLLCRPADQPLAGRLGANFRCVTETSGLYSIREQLSIPLGLARLKPDLFHSPHYVLPPLAPCRAVVTIHDCIHLIFPQYLRRRMAYAYARTMFWTAVHRASRILTVSEASKRDILRFFDVPESKVTVIYNAIDDLFFDEPPEEEIVRVRERYQLHERFVMYGGNVSPHKNIERLIDAFVLLRQDGLDDLKLLVTGGEVSRYASLRRAVHRHNMHQHIRFLGYQSTTTLAALYRLADVFVFPSLYEGFGLPPLEAMASGTPVVVSNVSSLPEVVGDGAILVNPYDPRAIANGVRQALGDAALRERLRERGLARARSFSWSASVRKLHGIYQELGARPGRS